MARTKAVTPTKLSSSSSSTRSGPIGSGKAPRFSQGNATGGKQLHLMQRLRAATKKRPPMPTATPVRRRGKKGAHGSRSMRGALAQSEVIEYQKSTNILFQRIPFIRLVRTIVKTWATFFQQDFRLKANVVDALLEATQEFATQLFANALLATTHAGRNTVLPEDMQLALVFMSPDGRAKDYLDAMRAPNPFGHRFGSASVGRMSQEEDDEEEEEVVSDEEDVTAHDEHTTMTDGEDVDVDDEEEEEEEEDGVEVDEVDAN